MVISVQPVIGYKSVARPGQSYLMTVDLRAPGDEWPFEKEEYPLYCIVNSGSLFSVQAMGVPAIVLHRFGGTYGPATFLVTAGERIGQCSATVTFVARNGLTVHTAMVQLRVAEEGALETQRDLVPVSV